MRKPSYALGVFLVYAGSRFLRWFVLHFLISIRLAGDPLRYAAYEKVQRGHCSCDVCLYLRMSYIPALIMKGVINVMACEWLGRDEKSARALLMCMRILSICRRSGRAGHLSLKHRGVHAVSTSGAFLCIRGHTHTWCGEYLLLLPRLAW